MYVRPSHKKVDGLMKLASSQLNESNNPDDDREPDDQLLSRQTRRNLAISTLHRGLFLENSDMIRDIARDCVKIYSRTDNGANCDIFQESTCYPTPYFTSYLEKLNERHEQTTKPFLRNTFRQVMKFITRQNRESHHQNINYLLSFINELRVAHSTSIHEDKKIIQLVADQTIVDVVDTITKDASLFLYWACIEVAKYCVIESNLSDDMNVEDFLTILDIQLSYSGKFSEKYYGKFYVIFIQSLEKALSYDLEESIKRCSFVSSASSSKTPHIPYNQLLNKWVTDNRKRLAKLSLNIDDAASCWRNIDLKLCNDLAFKRKSFTSLGDEVPFEQTLDSLNSRQWRENLSLITEAAMKLDDLDLLYGIESLISESGLICEFPPLRPMISNLEGSFEKTHAGLVNKCHELDEQSLNEFLKSCIELNLLKENAVSVELLQSDWLKDSYRKLIKSADNTQQSFETRLHEVGQWIETWSDSHDPLDINLIMPAYLGTISKPPQELLPASHDRAEWMISQEFIAQSLFSPSAIQCNLKIHNLLIDMLKLKDEDKRLPSDLVKLHSKDLRWNSTLFRHISDLNWLDLLRQQNDEQIDIVQCRAFKYHRKCLNNLTAVRLAEDLIEHGTSSEARVHGSLLMMNEFESSIDKFEGVLEKIESSILDDLVRNDLRLKILRRYLRTCSEETASTFIKEINRDETDSWKLQTSGEFSHHNWQDVLNSSGDLPKLKTLLLISEVCQQKSHRNESINSALGLDLQLLKQLNQYNQAKYKSSAIECALRILKCIHEHHSKLDEHVLSSFRNREFHEQTIQTWILIKNNLISLASVEKGHLPISWREALVDLLKVIACSHPNALLYSTIVNHLESKYMPKPDASVPDDPRPTSTATEDKQFDIWRSLYVHMTTKVNGGTEDWLDVVQDTEEFVRELRKLSYLSGENLQELSVSVTKKLAKLSERIHDHISSNGGRFPSESARLDCEARLSSICSHAIKQIDVLLLFAKGPHPDTYGTWFKADLTVRLHQLVSQFEQLNNIPPLEPSEGLFRKLKMSSYSINNMFGLCQQVINNYSNQLWMNLISPKLSHLESSEIPMPGCDDSHNLNKPTVTIYKVSQTIEIVSSQTKPKRITLIGSDGKSRSFLLKAHDDLRQDQYVMDFFTATNRLLSGHKQTQGICRLRNYTVTPISSKAGLIQWINATALTGVYKDWLASPSGRAKIEDLYSSTCRVVCGTAEVGAPKSDHINCQMPDDIHVNNSLNVFYQLLWFNAIQIQSRHHFEFTRQKPSRYNILRYRSEFGASLFQGVLEQLTQYVPDHLISNSLWYKSINSHSYWKKTKQFTQSCATISMVGYIIGLGDRHLSNILLDYDTGEVIHVDFNLWFESGKKLRIPEHVPFRLTPNLTRAFGFAGLEGGFTRTCRKVLNLMRERKSTILHLLDPINWSFKILSPDSTETFTPTSHVEVGIDTENVSPTNSDLESDPHTVSARGAKEAGSALGSERDSLTRKCSNQDDMWYLDYEKLQLGSVDFDENQRPILHDLHLNMEMPAKLLEVTARKMFARVCDKLSGTDEQLDSIIAQKASLRASLGAQTDTIEQQADLIQLNNCQSVEDQVDALITEATSFENKAAMYEGWTSWV